MRDIPVPFEVQQRAADRAWALTQDFVARLSLEQLVRMHVILMVGPERLGWSECGEAIALDAHIKIIERREASP